MYGSGGFCSYTERELQEQLGGWAAQGLPAVKMKVGRDARADPERVRAAREAIGGAGLFVDANGAYSRKQALALADVFAGEGVTWLEEPVSSDDLAGLRLVRDRAPPGMDVAAGEYGYAPEYFRRMLEAGAVDVLQADADPLRGRDGLPRRRRRRGRVRHPALVPLRPGSCTRRRSARRRPRCTRSGSTTTFASSGC